MIKNLLYLASYSHANFPKAVNAVKLAIRNPGFGKILYQQKIKLYSLYHQSIQGDPNAEPLEPLQAHELQMKNQIAKQYKANSRKQAMEQYTKFVRMLLKRNGAQDYIDF